MQQAFSAGDYSAYCLAHLFTYTNFDNGVLGLAWVASSSPGSFGGICSPCKLSSCISSMMLIGDRHSLYRSITLLFVGLGMFGQKRKFHVI